MAQLARIRRFGTAGHASRIETTGIGMHYKTVRMPILGYFGHYYSPSGSIVLLHESSEADNKLYKGDHQENQKNT